MPHARHHATDLLLLALASWPPAHPTTPPRGPGAVLEAVEGLLAAADDQDAAGIQSWFSAKPPKAGADFVLDPKTSSLTYQDAPRAAGYLHFVDRGVDGQPISCTEASAAVDALRTRIGGTKCELQHRILSVHADCPSGACSWAVVTFERTFRRDGQRVCQPMRATVLVHYQDEASRMRIFHWHASAAGPEQLQKG